MRVDRTLLVAFFALGACSDDAAVRSASGPVVRDSAGIRVVENGSPDGLPLCALEGPELTIGDRTGEPGHDLYRVGGAALLEDGRIALANTGTDELRFYDADGELLGASGGPGDGPGEFNNSWLLERLSGDTLLIGDRPPWHYEVFGPDGEWVRTIQPRPRFFNPPGGGGVLDGGALVLVERELAPSRTFEPGPGRVLWYGPDATLRDTLAELEMLRTGTTTNENFYISTWFASRPVVEAGGEVFVRGRTDVPELDVFEVDGRPVLATILRWQAGDRTVTSEVLDEAREATRARFAGDEGSAADERSAELVEMYLHEDRPVEDRYPAFAGVRLGTDGAIWVSMYDPVAQAASSEWVRFGPDGTMGCRLRLPDGSTVQEFGPDHLLLRRTNDLSVERIELHRWRRPGEEGS